MASLVLTCTRVHMFVKTEEVKSWFGKYCVLKHNQPFLSSSIQSRGLLRLCIGHWVELPFSELVTFYTFFYLYFMVMKTWRAKYWEGLERPSCVSPRRFICRVQTTTSGFFFCFGCDTLIWVYLLLVTSFPHPEQQEDTYVRRVFNALLIPRCLKASQFQALLLNC
jgi:hypothetical protein